jgi:hypothetical protein
LIGHARDGLGQPQFLNNTIITEIPSGPLAQEVDNPLRSIHMRAPLRSLSGSIQKIQLPELPKGSAWSGFGK